MWRNIPDVSFIAQNVFIVDTQIAVLTHRPGALARFLRTRLTGEVLSGQQTSTGGTSAATPLWAGVAALMNEYVANTTGAGTVGYINPMIYNIGLNPANYAADFHDIADDSGAPNTCGFSFSCRHGL